MSCCDETTARVPRTDFSRRSLLKGHVLQALHTLVTRHLEREEYAAGIDYANSLLAIEPWREETHRHLMVLLARSRQRSAALAQYETCCRVLARELGVEPMPETTALYEHIRAAAAPPPHNLPPQPTAFVGRQAELAEVARFLSNPGAQLLTLVGPGGIGKTRLALQAAARCVSARVRVVRVRMERKTRCAGARATRRRTEAPKKRRQRRSRSRVPLSPSRLRLP